jgi:hypothetical protein
VAALVTIHNDHSYRPQLSRLLQTRYGRWFVGSPNRRDKPKLIALVLARAPPRPQPADSHPLSPGNRSDRARRARRISRPAEVCNYDCG